MGHVTPPNSSTPSKPNFETTPYPFRRIKSPLELAKSTVTRVFTQTNETLKSTYTHLVPSLAQQNLLVSIATSTVGITCTVPPLTTIALAKRDGHPRPSVSTLSKITLNAAPFQYTGKVAQYITSVYCIKQLNTLSPNTPTLNTLLGFGFVAVPFQQLLYNNVSKHKAKIAEKSPPTHRLSTSLKSGSEQLVGYLKSPSELMTRPAIPGTLVAIPREIGGLGLGLVIGDWVTQTCVNPFISGYPIVAKGIGGFLSGLVGAILTQPLQEAALAQINHMRQYNTPIPYKTFIQETLKTQGLPGFYKSLPQRALVIALVTSYNIASGLSQNLKLALQE